VAGREPTRFYTAYGLWGLYLAKQAGYAVDSSRIEEAIQYLQNDGANPRDKTHRSTTRWATSRRRRSRRTCARSTKDKSAAGGRDDDPGRGQATDLRQVYAARALASASGPRTRRWSKVVDELAALAAAATQVRPLIDEPLENDHGYYMASDTRTTSAVLLASSSSIRRTRDQAPRAHDHDGAPARPPFRSWDTHANFTPLARADHVREGGRGRRAVGDGLRSPARISSPARWRGKQKLRVVTQPLPAQAELTITPSGEVATNVPGPLPCAPRNDQGGVATASSCRASTSTNRGKPKAEIHVRATWWSSSCTSRCPMTRAM